jgi:hypothetical protein
VIKLEEKNNPMPQVPEVPVITPVGDKPELATPPSEVQKEVSPVVISWKKPIIKIIIVGVIAVALFLLIKG